MNTEKQEYIICPTIKRLNPRKNKCYYQNDICDIELGYRHHDILIRYRYEVSTYPEDQGFYTSKGRFVSREEAMQIAISANQVSKNIEHDELYSEDLY